MNKLIIFGVVVLIILMGIYFFPKETITITELPAIKLPAIVIP